MSFDPGKITDTIAGIFENPELNQTRAALEKLAEEVKRNLGLETLLKKVQEAFFKDLNELNVPQNLHDAYWEKINERVRQYIEERMREAAAASPEASALDAFVGDISNLAELEPLIQNETDKNPIKKWWNGVKEQFPQIGTWAAAWFAGEAAKDVKTGADGKKEQGLWGRFCGMLAKRLGGGQENPPGAGEAEQQTQGQTPAAQTEAAPTAANPLESDQIKEFVAVHPLSDPAKAQADYDELMRIYGNSPGTINANARAAGRPNSNTDQLYKEIVKKCNNDTAAAKPRLLDIRFEDVKFDDIANNLIPAIRDSANTNPDKFREFLDEVLRVADVNFTNLDRTIDSAKSKLS